MALILDYTDPDTGAVGNYFRILRIVGVCAPNEPDPRWEVWVGMYANQEIRTKGSGPLKQYQINVPFSDLAVDPRQGAMPGFYSVIKNYGPFAGQVVQDMVDDSPDITLDAMKSIKNDEINKARLAANLSSFPYQGKQISCDTLSRSDIDGTNGYVALMGAFPDGWVGQWKATDNTYVPIATLDDWKAFYAAMVAQGQQNFAHAQALKQVVSQCQTVEDVRAIDWSTPTA
jgi:hypothetical protein